MIVWAAASMVNDCSTSGAAAWLPLPGCVARTTTVPTPVMVTMLPSMVAGPEKMLKATDRPDEDDAGDAERGIAERPVGERAECDGLGRGADCERLVDVEGGTVGVVARLRSANRHYACARDRHDVAVDGRGPGRRC